jgi:hypothetical protein
MFCEKCHWATGPHSKKALSAALLAVAKKLLILWRRSVFNVDSQGSRPERSGKLLTLADEGDRVASKFAALHMSPTGTSRHPVCPRNVRCCGKTGSDMLIVSLIGFAHPVAKMQQATSVAVVGAGPAGLAAGACLRKAGLDFIILEKEDQVGASWRRHYARLHLHTVKQYSSLPFLPFPKDYPRYVPRELIIRYLEN